VVCALASVARGRPVKAVCEALGVARSNVVRLRGKPVEQVDRRRLAKDPKADTKRSVEGPGPSG
jgi:hypothetical protein